MLVSPKNAGLFLAWLAVTGWMAFLWFLSFFSPMVADACVTDACENQVVRAFLALVIYQPLVFVATTVATLLPRKTFGFRIAALATGAVAAPAGAVILAVTLFPSS